MVPADLELNGWMMWRSKNDEIWKRVEFLRMNKMDIHLPQQKLGWTKNRFPLNNIQCHQERIDGGNHTPISLGLSWPRFLTNPSFVSGDRHLQLGIKSDSHLSLRLGAIHANCQVSISSVSMHEGTASGEKKLMDETRGGKWMILPGGHNYILQTISEVNLSYV